jgi:serine/threonine protein kinase/Flp pilus assembly protein TadD
MRESVGRYAVTGTLGEGGMGVVYSAIDGELGRAVAIKMIKATATEPAARERLRREARTAASVNHPAICQLYEIGEVNGELFLAMELLQGESLAARIARGGIAVTDVVSLALGILTGMEALHKQGLVHRDLKPSNIFITPHGVKLLDFGLTTAVQRLGDETQIALTAPGTVVGTPQYAAPEQLRNGTLDARTDIFAAGCVLYEMLTGRPPFGGMSVVEVFHAIMYEQPPALTGSPAVSALDRIVYRAIAKKPEDRYQTAEDMALDLRSAMALGDSGSSAAIAHPVTRLIVLPFRMLRPDPETAFLAFSLADAVTSSLSGLQSLVVRSSLAAARFASESPDIKAIGNDAEVDAILVGTLMRSGNQLRVSTQLVGTPASTVLWSHTAQVAIGDLFSLQDDLAGRIVESLSLPLTQRERRMLKQDVPATPEVYEHYLRANEMSRDSRNWRPALELYEQCTQEDPHYAPAWTGVGRMQRMIGKYEEDESEERFSKAEVALKRALELNPDLSPAENVYAHLEVDLGRAEQAMVRLLRRARERTSDPELFAGLAHACRYCGLLSASMAAATHALRLDPKIRTSAGQTCFMRQDYAGVTAYEPAGINYMRSLALVMLGQTDEALASLTTADRSLPPLLGIFVTALEQLVRGNREESLAGVRRLTTLKDPEGRFYMARHLAYLGDVDEALAVLALVVPDGFFCLPALTRDPWLDSLRALPAFVSILREAEARHRQAVISFLVAEGDRVLGISHPV